MLTFTTLKSSPRRFLSMTSVTIKEFLSLLPLFAEEYAATHSMTHTQTGQSRQRQVGGGNTPRLATIEDKLLFILVYQKTYPLQTAQGLQFGLGQPQAHEWIHRLMPILQKALTRAEQMPQRNPKAFKDNSGLLSPPDFIIDGTERRRQRPKDPEKQRESYSGKKKRTRIKTSF